MSPVFRTALEIIVNTTEDPKHVFETRVLPLLQAIYQAKDDQLFHPQKNRNYALKHKIERRKQ